MSNDFSLQDIPDLSSLETGSGSTGGFEPFETGWYQGVILAKREFTDKNGNDRVFESSDTPAQTNGRNIRLQVELTRKKDGNKLNVSTLVNYRPGDLTSETLQAVSERQKAQQAGEAEWGDLFRPFMTLKRLGSLQKIGGVRQLQRSPEGGLDITPVFGKTAYFRIKPDPRNEKYMEIADFQLDAPKKAPVL